MTFPSLALFLARFLLLAPKVNLIRFPSTAIGLKPEDIVVPTVLLALVAGLRRIPTAWTRLPTALAVTAGLAAAYLYLVAMVTLWYGGNLLFVGRYALYFALLLFAWAPPDAVRAAGPRIERLAFGVLAVYLSLAWLQKRGVIGGFLLGEFTPDVSGRVNGVFSNATELGAVSTMLLGLLTGGRLHTALKLSALMVVAAINILGQNRIALVAMLLALVAYGLANARTLIVAFHGTPVLRVRRRHLAAGLLGAALVLSATFRDLPRFASVGAVESIAYARAYVGRYFTTNAPTFNIEAQLGREQGEEVDESLAMRIQRWTHAASLIASGHIVGVGAGTAGDGMDGFAFRILAETGLPGLVLYGLLFGVVTLVVWPPVEPLPGLRYAYLVLLVHAVFFDILYFSRVGYLFWLLLGLRLGSARTRA